MFLKRIVKLEIILWHIGVSAESPSVDYFFAFVLCVSAFMFCFFFIQKYTDFYDDRKKNRIIFLFYRLSNHRVESEWSVWVKWSLCLKMEVLRKKTSVELFFFFLLLFNIVFYCFGVEWITWFDSGFWWCKKDCTIKWKIILIKDVKIFKWKHFVVRERGLLGGSYGNIKGGLDNELK